MRKDIDARKDEIIAWLDEGYSQLECARRLGCKIDTLRSRLKLWNVTTSNRGRKGFERPTMQKSVQDYLNNYKDGPIIGSHALKLKLWKSGLKPEHCEICGWKERSIDGRLPLELDHVDNDHFNNRIENLQILCPNCHALKPGNSGQNRGQYSNW